MPSWITRTLSWIAALVVGAVYGIAATIAHAFTAGPIPVGMLVGGIACAALLVALRALTNDRWAALAAGAGMLGALFVISQRSPGGSVLVPNTLLGNIWVYVVAGIVLIVVAWPDLERLRSARAAPAAPGSLPDGQT